MSINKHEMGIGNVDKISFKDVRGFFEPLKPRKQEALKPRDQETLKPRNQETKKPRTLREVHSSTNRNVFMFMTY